MASLLKTGKSWRTQFNYCGKRRTVSFGTVDRGTAKEWLAIVERLINYGENDHSIDMTTEMLVTELPIKVQEKLKNIGLIGGRKSFTIADLCNYCIAELDGKESTVNKRKNVRANLLAFFDPDTPLERITPGDADEFRRWLRKFGGRGSSKELARSTVSRRCGMAKEWFKIAIRKGWLRENPFADQSRECEANAERNYFVGRKLFQQLIDSTSCDQFRLVMALSRYGGLRSPSEVTILQWDWIDWHEQVMHVRAPKTEHIEGRGVRIVPIFPELRPYLDAVYQSRDRRSELVISDISHDGGVLTGRLEVLCRRNNIVLWPKPWQNMRSSRETELVEVFPIHVATAWIGNTESVAKRHYLQVTKEHYEAAVRPSAALKSASPNRAAKALH